MPRDRPRRDGLVPGAPSLPRLGSCQSAPTLPRLGGAGALVSVAPSGAWPMANPRECPSA
eukprot:16429612-Heterocapsa_arctica.AAC.1